MPLTIKSIASQLYLIKDQTTCKASLLYGYIFLLATEDIYNPNDITLQIPET
jgi:hypothetical protein